MTESTPTRKIVANITLSLDGRVNGAGGASDMGWIVPHALSDAARDHMVRLTSSATTALLGRTNYEGFASYWPAVADQADADPRDRAFARWLDGAEKVVVSSTLTASTWANTMVSARPPGALVNDLRSQPGGDIVVLSSGSVIRQLLAADAVDRLCVLLCPEVVGGGDRLFDDTLPASAWRLTSSAPCDTGATVLTYERAR